MMNRCLKSCLTEIRPKLVLSETKALFKDSNVTPNNRSCCQNQFRQLSGEAAPFHSSTPKSEQGPLSAYHTDDKTYKEEFEWSRADPSGFWAEQASKLDWHTPWRTVLDDSHPPFTKWFSGGQLNICHNALDRHVDSNGLGDHVALVHDSPVLNSVTRVSYSELRNKVASFAGALRAKGVGVGDRVIIYMPMIPETVIAMLAVARLGAIHTIVFGGFAAKELSVRIEHSNAKALVTASAGIEPNRVINYKPIVDEAIELVTNKPTSVFVYRRPGIGESELKPGRDYDFTMEMDTAVPVKEPVPIEANEPLYIVHTSGTTGFPKGVVRPCGGYAVVLPWTMRAVYGMRPGETWWAASDFGWVVGHSYLCYGPLLAGLTSVIYEGKPVGTPDAGQYFRLIQDHKITNSFAAPTALRAIHQADADVTFGKQYDTSSLRAIHAAGEHLDYETRRWAEGAFGAPVLDHWWQTETGWPICASCSGYPDVSLNPPKDASGKAVPGFDVHVLSNEGNPLQPGELGRIAIKLPLPPGCISTFWGGKSNDEHFVNEYFQRHPGYYDTMDAGAILPADDGVTTEEGYVAVMSRVDDVINVAGHRISAGALEEAILEHETIVDCAVIAVKDPLKGLVPLALCVPRDDYNPSLEDQITQDVIKLVRDQVGAVASLKTVLIVHKLPKTRSGKIARNTLVNMAASKPFAIPVTIEDAGVYPKIKAEMQKIGLAM